MLEFGNIQACYNIMLTSNTILLWHDSDEGLKGWFTQLQERKQHITHFFICSCFKKSILSSSIMSNVKDSSGSVDHRSHWRHMCSHVVCPEYLRHILLVQVWPRNPPQGFGKRLWLKHVMLKKKDLVVSTWITDISKLTVSFPWERAQW